MTDAVYIKGLDKLIGKLDSIAKLKTVKAGIKAGALHIKGKIADYPPRKYVSIKSVGGWKSEKQRRWFFWALRTGQIEVPYRRGVSPMSQDLGGKWTIKERDGGMTAVVGNNVSYGPFVQSAANQSPMMRKIGWKTTEKVADEEGPRVRELIAKAIRKALA